MAPTTKGVSHVQLTVTDVDRSKEWYGRVLGWTELMAAEDDGARMSIGILPDGVVVGFHTGAETVTGAFDPHRVGLDHLSFAVDSREDLDQWAEHLAELEVSFSPTVDAPYGHVLSFKDPDEIALELFVFAAPAG
jgi:glyoxylase I family protein